LHKFSVKPETYVATLKIVSYSIMLYRSEYSALSKADASKSDAQDEWCLRRILNTCCYQHLSNDEVQLQTKQPPLT